MCDFVSLIFIRDEYILPISKFLISSKLYKNIRFFSSSITHNFFPSISDISLNKSDGYFLLNFKKN